MLVEKRNNINARQIKAARVLLDWSQEDLASASGLSIATIRKIESGSISPRDKTMGSIVSALEEVNIEFMDSTGVRLKDQSVVVIEGDSCYARLLDEIYYSMHDRGGEILFMNADGSRITEAEMAGHIRLRKAGIKFRILIEEGNTHIHFPLNEFRWVPHKYFRYNILVLFQNKVALCFYDKTTEREMDRIHIINNVSLVEALRCSFDFMWENCRKPTITTAKETFV